MKKYLIGAGVGILVLFAATTAILRLALKPEPVKTKMEAMFRDNTGGETTIGALELSLPFSLTMHDVTVRDRQGRNELRIEQVRAQFVLWRLFLLSPTARLTANAGNGLLSITISSRMFSSMVHLAIEAKNFPLDKAIMRMGGAPPLFLAELDADGMFSIPRHSPADLNGNASISLHHLSLRSDSMWGALLKNMVPESASCSVKAEDRKLTTGQCAIATSMGLAEMRAVAELNDPVDASPLGGAMVFNPAEKLADTAMALYLAHRKPDGAYYFTIKGTLGNPEIEL